jgi:hypothetical protein
MWSRLLLFVFSLALLIAAFVLVVFDPFAKGSRAGLQIEYQAGNASIFLNDNYLGKAPLIEEKLQKGDYILKIEPDDKSLSSFTTPIYLEKGTLSIVVYNPGPSTKESSSTIFELRKRTDKESSVSFESYPENALISFDQQAMTFSPLVINPVKPGEHHFSASLPSYEAQDHSFLVLPGYETKITVNLAKNTILPLEPTGTSPAAGAAASVVASKLEEASSSASTSAVASDSAAVVE